MEVDWHEERLKWVTEPIDANSSLIGHIQQELDAIEQMSKQDLQRLTSGFKKSSKRRACPEWSVPNEVLLMVLAPTHCTATAKRDE